MKSIVNKPVFWLGTALIVFSYFTAKGSSTQVGTGAENALTVLGIAGGAALIIYAVNKTG